MIIKIYHIITIDITQIIDCTLNSNLSFPVPKKKKKKKKTYLFQFLSRLNWITMWTEMDRRRPNWIEMGQTGPT